MNMQENELENSKYAEFKPEGDVYARNPFKRGKFVILARAMCLVSKG
jgi:hypothetical protein